MSEPAKTLCESKGSIANAFTGTSGIPEPDATHVGLPERRFVVFQTCCPAARPKPFSVTYATFALFGSIATRPTYLAGIGPVTSLMVVEPGVVEQIYRPVRKAGKADIIVLRRDRDSGYPERKCSADVCHRYTLIRRPVKPIRSKVKRIRISRADDHRCVEKHCVGGVDPVGGAAAAEERRPIRVTAGNGSRRSGKADLRTGGIEIGVVGSDRIDVRRILINGSKTAIAIMRSNPRSPVREQEFRSVVLRTAE